MRVMEKKGMEFPSRQPPAQTNGDPTSEDQQVEVPNKQPSIGKKEEGISLQLPCVDLSPCGYANDSEIACPDIGPVADPARMRDSGFCPPSSVDDLWAQKARLDAIFDAGHAQVYRRARQEVFPAAGVWGSGGGLGNRAGEKFAEMADIAGGMPPFLQPSPSETVFLDICGAPGGWSKCLFHMGESRGARMRGYGMSLKDGTNPLSCAWYPELRKRDNFTQLWGEDGTGDVCSPANIAHASRTVGRSAHLVVADGGFGVSIGDSGEHLENYQEIVASRIILAEVFLALETLVAGGSIICKFFDVFSRLMVELLFILSAMFAEVKVVKPRSSRVVNSERYVVATGFRGIETPGGIALLDMARAAHAAWRDVGANPWSGNGPLHILPRHWDLQRNHPAFASSVSEVAAFFCQRQAAALKAVADRACELVKEGHTASDRGFDRRAKRRRRHIPEIRGKIVGECSAVNPEAASGA